MTFFPLRLLDRYILKQLLDYYLLGVVVFTLIAFFSDTFLDFIQDVQRLGIPFSTVFTLMGLQLPKMIALILPASTFLAVLMVYNALNGAFEVIAIRMNGISLNRLMAPALALGLFSTLIAYLLADYIVPYCNAQTERLKTQAMAQGALPQGQQSFMLKDYDPQHQLRQMIYVRKYKGQELKDSTIVDLSRPGTLQVIQAKSGHWYPEHWAFNNANAYTVSKTNEILFFNHLGHFTVKNLISRTQKTEEIPSNPEEAALTIDSDTQPFWHLYQVIQKREALGKRVAKGTYIKLWEKITLPLSCLVVILTAIPLALTPPRQGTNRGFVYAVGVLFLYYVLRSVFVALGRSGALTLGIFSSQTALALAAWMPLVVIGTGGYLLLRRKSKVL